MRLVSLFLLAVGATIASIYYSKSRSSLGEQQTTKVGKAKRKSKDYKMTNDEKMDDRLDDSFPASDSPSWGPKDLLH